MGCKATLEKSMAESLSAPSLNAIAIDTRNQVQDAKCTGPQDPARMLHRGCQPEVRLDEARRMPEISLGVILPHELLASFYEYEGGKLFYMLLTGVPGVSWLFSMSDRNTEALRQYWDNNRDLQDALRHELQDDLDFEYAIPFRVYGDCADAQG